MESSAAKPRDNFSISYFVWVALFGLLLVASNDLDRIFNLYLLLVPVVYLPALAVTIYWIVALIRNLVLRRWRRVVSVLAAPAAAYILFAGLAAAGVEPQWIRFRIWRGYYLDQVAHMPRTGEPRFKLFDWGGTGGVAVTNIMYTLAYDETDELLLPPEQRTKEWRGRAGRLCPGTIMCSILTPPPGVSVTVRKLDDHFYLVTEIFG